MFSGFIESHMLVWFESWLSSRKSCIFPTTQKQVCVDFILCCTCSMWMPESQFLLEHTSCKLRAEFHVNLEIGFVHLKKNAWCDSCRLVLFRDITENCRPQNRLLIALRNCFKELGEEPRYKNFSGWEIHVVKPNLPRQVFPWQWANVT